MRNGYSLRTPQLSGALLLDPWSRCVLFPLVIDSISSYSTSSVLFSNTLSNAWLSLTTETPPSQNVSYTVAYLDGNSQQSSALSFQYTESINDCVSLVASPSNFLTLGWTDFYPIHRTLRFMSNSTHCTDYEHQPPIISPAWITEESLAYCLVPGVLTIDPKHVAQYLGPGDMLSFSITPVYAFQNHQIIASSYSLQFHISVTSVDYVHYHFDYPLHVIGAQTQSAQLTPLFASRWGPSLYQVSWSACSVSDCQMSSSSSRIDHTLNLVTSSLPLNPIPVFYDTLNQQYVQTGKYSRIPSPSLLQAATLTSLSWKVGVQSLPLSRALGFDLWIEFYEYPDLSDPIYSDGSYSFDYTVSLLTTDQYMVHNNHLYIYPVFNLRHTVGTELTIGFSVTANGLTQTATLTIALTGSWGSDFSNSASLYETGKTAYSENAKISTGNAAFPFTSNLIYETWCVKTRLIIYRDKVKLFSTYDPTFYQRWPDTCTANYEIRACTQIGECVAQTINALSLAQISSFSPQSLHHSSSYFLFTDKLASLPPDSLDSIVAQYISNYENSWLQGLATPFKCGTLKCINPLHVDQMITGIQSVPLSSLSLPLAAHLDIYRSIATYVTQIQNTFLYAQVPLAQMYYFFSRIRVLFLEIYGAFGIITDPQVQEDITSYADLFLWMLPSSLPTPLHPSYPLSLSTVSSKLNQTVIDNRESLQTSLLLQAGSYKVSIPAEALNSLDQNEAHYLSILSSQAAFTKVNNQEQTLSSFKEVLQLQARREASPLSFISENKELGIVYQADSKILLEITGVSDTVGPFARYDSDTQWWRTLNVTQSASHDPSNGIYSYLLPKYGKYAFLSSSSPLVVPVSRAITNTNFIYFFTNIELVRSEYSQAELITLLEEYFQRVRTITLKESLSSISVKNQLEDGLAQTVRGVCIILPECLINSSQMGILNPNISSQLIDKISELIGILASSFLSLPSNITLPSDWQFLSSQYSSLMDALLPFMKHYQTFFSHQQTAEFKQIRATAAQGCSLLLPQGEQSSNSDSQFVKVSAYKGSGQEAKQFKNQNIPSRPQVTLPSSIFQDRSFVVIFKKPDKFMDGFSIIGSQIIQVQAYSSSGQALVLQNLEQPVTISISDYGVQTCDDLEMRYWDQGSVSFSSDGISSLDSTDAPLCSFQTTHLSEFAVGIAVGNFTITNVTQVTQVTTQTVQVDNIWAIATLVVFSLIILTVALSEDIRACRTPKRKNEADLTQEGKVDLLPPSFCRRWCILITQLHSFLSFFTARKRLFLSSTQALIVLFRLWFIALLVSAAVLTSETPLLISLLYLILLFLRPLGIFLVNLKFSVSYDSRNRRVDPLEGAVISEEALTSQLKVLATSTHRLHAEEQKQSEPIHKKNDDKNSESSNAVHVNQEDVPKTTSAEQPATPPPESPIQDSQNYESLGIPQPRSLAFKLKVKEHQLREKAVLLPILGLSLILFVVLLSLTMHQSELIGQQVYLSWIMYVSFVLFVEPLLFLVGVQLMGKQVLRRRTNIAHFLLLMILGPKNLILLSERLG